MIAERRHSYNPAYARQREERLSGLRQSSCPEIVLMTDFGGDRALGRCKSSLISVCNKEGFQIPEFDSVADVQRHSIVHGAFTIYDRAKTALPGTIFIGVVDPGVGTDREAIIIKTKRRDVFVGPNNGIFYPAASKQEIEGVWQINGALFPEACHTFHGMDIFTPTAGLIACGVNPDDLGQRIGVENLDEFNFKPGQIVERDPFGNLKIWGYDDLPEVGRTVYVGTEQGYFEDVPVVETFGDVSPGELLVFRGSSDCVEVAINLGSAGDLFDIQAGDFIKIAW